MQEFVHPNLNRNTSTGSTVEGIMKHLGPFPTASSDRWGSAHEKMSIFQGVD